jgi:hypothetical protein
VRARSRGVALALASLVALLPRIAAACATCVSSAFGDQTYNWPYFGLIVMPFVVTGVLGAVLYHYRGTFRSTEAESEPPDRSAAVETLLDKEMT